MSSSDEGTKSAPEGQNDKPRNREKHWLEYAIFFFVVLTAGGTMAAAYYTRQQYIVADDAEKRQLRAYVGILQHGMDHFGDQNQVIKTSTKNYGLTPARDLYIDPQQQHWDVVRLNAPVFSPAMVNPPNVKNTFTLFPSQESHYYFHGNALSRQQIDLVRDGTEYELLVWGIVYYKDVFDVSHSTRYCWSFRGSSMTEADVEICLQHNDAY
jgi:hypothetical protein